MTLFNQHLPSNCRATTDDYLVPGYVESDNRELVKQYINAYEYIEISDESIEEIREASQNTLTIGEAVAILLARQWKDYKGLTHDSSEDIIDGVESVEKAVGEYLKKEIFDSIYIDRTSYYFLR